MAVDKRLGYMDVAKGIAMICIILGHQGSWEINRFVFTFHVPIFFLITGYFTSAKLPVKEFVKRKIRTLLVPYACTCLAIIAFAAILALYRGEDVVRTVWDWAYASIYGAGDPYTEPFYIKAIGALWFLLASFWGSVLLRLALQMKKGTRLAFVLALFAIGYWTARNLFWFPFSIQAGCASALYMYLGYLARQIQPQYEQLSSEVKAIVVVFAALIWGEFWMNFQSFWLVHVNIGRGIGDIVGSICGSYLLLLISKYIVNKWAVVAAAFRYLGRYSLFMLSIHILELHLFPWWTVQNLLIGIGLTEVVVYWMLIVFKVLLVCIATVICSKMKWMTRLFGMEKTR